MFINTYLCLNIQDFKVDTGAGSAYISKLGLTGSPSVTLGSASAVVSWTVPASQLDAIGNHSYAATIDISYAGLSKRREAVVVEFINAVKRAIPDGSQVKANKYNLHKEKVIITTTLIKTTNIQIQHKTAQHNTNIKKRRNSTQYNTTQRNTKAQHNTTQHNTKTG